MWVVVMLSLFAGWFAYANMPRFEDPEFTIRVAQVLTPYPGGSPEEVAREVTAPLESALQDMAEVKEINSVSSDGYSEISVEIKFDASPSKEKLQIIWTKLRNKVADAAVDLPPGAGPSIVFDEFGDVFGFYYILTGEGFTMAEMREYAQDLRQEVLSVKGVGKVNIAGEQDEVIYVEISRENEAVLGGTINSIFNQLSTQNTVVSGGSVRIEDKRLVITPTGDIDSVDAIKNLVVTASDGRVIRLGNVARVTRGYEDPASFEMYYDGKPALALGVAAVSNSNVVDIGKAISAKLVEVEDQRPVGMELHDFYDQGEVVDQSVIDFVINVIIALVIVISTLFLFMGPRSGIVIGAGLLLTIAATLGTMYMANIPMHRISLGALIIALGMLVDNAIVVTDGILVGTQKGRKMLDIAGETVRKSIWPLLGGTLVGILAFAPIGLAPGETAEFTGDLFWVILISLLYSWVFAITLTPFFCSLLFKPGDTNDGIPEEKAEMRFLTQFRSLVRRLIHARYVTISAAFGLFILSLFGFTFVTPGFFPASTTPQMVVDFWLPEGTDIAETDANMRSLAKLVGAEEGVEHVHTLVGGGTMRYMLIYQFESQNSAYGQLLVKVDDYERLNELIPKVQKLIDQNYTQAQGKAWRFVLGPGGGSKIEAKFTGPDPDKLRELANKAKAVYAADGGALSIRDDWRQKVATIEAQYSDVKGGRAGVSRTDLGNAMARNFSGQRVGVYREDDDLIPIISRAPASDRNNISNFNSIQVIGASGLTVPLAQVTDGVRTIWRDGKLRRSDRVWSIKAQADPVPGLLAGELQDRVQPKIEAIALPPGYSLEWEGEAGSSEEANANLMGAIPFGFGAMILVVILLFNALREPLIIWSVVPLALVGVVFGLIVMGVPFEFMAILGLLSLSGLLIKNAIVLVDQIDLEIGEGKPRLDAIVDSAASRVRPVLLGSGTTVLGVIPLFFDAFFQSMAVVLVFGLSFATVLTLVLVPVIYATVFKVSEEESAQYPAIIDDHGDEGIEEEVAPA